MKSGGILYNLPNCESEVTSLKFLHGSKLFILNIFNFSERILVGWRLLGWKANDVDEP
jgi:hypothetical protein